MIIWVLGFHLAIDRMENQVLDDYVNSKWRPSTKRKEPRNTFDRETDERVRERKKEGDNNKGESVEASSDIVREQTLSHRNIFKTSPS